MSKIYKAKLTEIDALAKELSKTIKGGEVFALMGNLGSGKTTFVKKIAKELKIKKHVTSPTFTIMNNYSVNINGLKKTLLHLDLYRLKNATEVWMLGLKEIWAKPQTITFIEWAEKIKEHLPKNTKIIKFKE
jgi:tRNA threonylcarbamoyladenosine biosynthesis protein TsaE